MITEFIEDALDDSGTFIEKTYKTNLSDKACRFCLFKKTEHCPES